MVDDEPIYRDLITKILNKHSKFIEYLDIKSCSSGNDALHLLQNEKIDLVILDIDLGCQSINGFEIAKSIKSSMKDTYICFHSNRFSVYPCCR